MARPQITTKKYASSAIDKVDNKLHDHGSGDSRNSHEKSWQLAMRVMTKRIEKIDVDTCEWEEVLPFMVGDVGEIYRQRQRWKMMLPRVEAHYAVKCNPEPTVIRLLARMNSSFDCASIPEVEAVLEHGVDPSKIILAHPRASVRQKVAAINHGVRQMTVDTKQQLHDAKKYFPTAKLLIRLAPDDSKSKCRLSAKFGCSFDKAKELLHVAKHEGLDVVGIAFHIGSDASDTQAPFNATMLARDLINYAEDSGLYSFSVLDVGGGFTDHLFEPMAASLKAALEFIPQSIRVIAEPGRFMVSSAFRLACQVNDIDYEGNNEGNIPIHINAGVYSDLANVISDHQVRIPKLLCKQDPSSESFRYRVWGPTCDNFDEVVKSCSLPKVSQHDWLYFEEMGAYTIPCATEFNGIRRADIMWVSSERGASSLLGWDADI
ncbi:uncharacterized protein KY384_001928 [Bacidia gigantensis]|uniref:uncharacterized protein n=1 Tax=Bacidia gigantensis TaxID=2732470 RepID=UPI001D03CD29|nr:uncharacterized protein KY384_001928 [Bacidia gigantensis]KAG8533145.1 hypothetical protein KY384_001928 [Bacidia gigantensis]